MKKTAEKSAVRWGWVILAVLFFFGACVSDALLGFHKHGMAQTIILQRLRYDFLGGTLPDGSADSTLQIGENDMLPFVRALQDCLTQKPAADENAPALPLLRGKDESAAAQSDTIQQLHTDLAGFNANGFEKESSVRVALKADGIVVWNNWQDPITQDPDDVSVFAHQQFPLKREAYKSLQDAVNTALRQVDPSLSMECCVLRTARYDLLGGDEFVRIQSLDAIAQGESGASVLRVEFFLLAFLTVLCVFLALWSVLREGRRTRNARRLIDQLPADLYIVCVLPLIVFLLWWLWPGHLSTGDPVTIRGMFTHGYGAFADVIVLVWKPITQTILFLLGLIALLLLVFSLRRGGLRYAFAYFRYEKVPFVHRTIYYLLFIQGVKILSLSVFLSGDTLADAQNSTLRFLLLMAFLVLEKAVTVPVLLRCVREMRRVMDTTARYVGGDLKGIQQDNGRGMYRSFAQHQQDVDSIARRIRDTADEYVQSSKFKAELITNLSHDIKTPLTSIINYAQLLGDPRLPEADKRHYLDVLGRHSDRLTKLVEDLTEVSDAASGNIRVEMTSIDLCTVIRQAALGFEERLGKRGITMRFYLPQEPVYVHADARLLWRVVDNLMNNICKYAAENTLVKIAVVDRRQTAVAVFHNVSATALSAASADALMERFVRGDVSRHTEGSGLGLSIARSLMDLQDGSLSLQTDKELFTAQITLHKI